MQWPNFYRKPHLTIDSLIEDSEEQMSASSNGQIAGFWAEPIMGAGGLTELPS